MSAALWSEILSARREIDASLASTLPNGADETVGREALRALRGTIHARLEELRAALAGELGKADVMEVMLPIILHINERVMARLSLDDRLDWPLLQDGVLQDGVLRDEKNGGEVFYAELDALLRPPVKASMIHEVYYWCLEGGFCGRYEERDPAIAKYKAGLQRALARPKVPASTRPDEAPAAAGERLPGRRFPPAVYYAGTAVLVALLCVVPMLLSNL
ncbi:DotU family type IV/VI secretion system protein [Sorangium sp. So ce136]|uniref:DotU family type IV/VI secretion system protein n=1 Tax=Sorangium sp. So ce136 TaxID=3133284 RepID=UPI003F12B891